MYATPEKRAQIAKDAKEALEKEVKGLRDQVQGFRGSDTSDGHSGAIHMAWTVAEQSRKKAEDAFVSLQSKVMNVAVTNLSLANPSAPAVGSSMETYVTYANNLVAYAESLFNKADQMPGPIADENNIQDKSKRDEFLAAAKEYQANIQKKIALDKELAVLATFDAPKHLNGGKLLAAEQNLAGLDLTGNTEANLEVAFYNSLKA